MLRIEHLTLTLGGRAVLDDICLTLPRGELCLLTGPNGAGKSTLLRCLAGTERFDRGVLYEGETAIDPSDPDWQRRVALVPDDNALLEELTAREHLELGCILAAVPSTQRAERCEPLVRLFGLEGHVDRRAGELSFGYRKRLAIALSLVHPSELYLFDEPLVGLDAESLDLFVNVVDLLRSRGRTVLVASHIATPLARGAGLRIELRGGRVRTDQPAADTAQPSEVELPWLA